MSKNDYVLGVTEVQQTILVLNLSIAQIELSISEGDHSVNALIDSFRYMSEHIETIQGISIDLGQSSLAKDKEFAKNHTRLLSQTNQLAEKMQQAIIAFQFYDKLSQRLGHVSYGLTGLSDIVSHEMKVKDSSEWEDFKKAVRRGTSMREEEELFELIFDQKIPTKEAIEIMKQRMTQRLKEAEEVEEIELF